MNNSGTNRYVAIDALRGIAALCVVWHHSAELFIKVPSLASKGTYMSDLFAQLDLGRMGIICFFLISGFVIPNSLKKHHQQPIRTFVRRRFYRLFPVYWLSLVTMVAFIYWTKGGFDVSSFFANLTMIQGFLGQPHIIGLYWTLQVELVFYLLCVLLFYINKLDDMKFIFVLISTFFLLFVILQVMYRICGFDAEFNKELQLLPYLLCVMFLGSFFRKWYDNKLNGKDRLYVVMAAGMCFGLPLLLLIISVTGIYEIEGGLRFGVSHLSGAIMFLLGLRFFKQNKFLAALGVISYSVYLFHPLIMKALFQLSQLTVFSFLLNFHVIIPVSMVSLLTLILAAGIYRMLEKPLIDFGHK